MDPQTLRTLHDQIEFSASPTKAEDLERAGLEIPVGELGRAKLLASAAEHWLLRGEPERARRAIEAAGDGVPGELMIQRGALWLMLDLDAGDPAQVERRLAELLATWRTGTMTYSTAHMVGDLMRAEGDLKRAQRWFTLPLNDADVVDTSDLTDPVVEMCLVDRETVRRELGLPVDSMDALATSL